MNPAPRNPSILRKAVPAALAAGMVLIAATAFSAPDHDFNGVVTGLEQHYATHGHRLPMMGLAGFCAGLVTHGGVKGLRVAEFNHLVLGPLGGDDISHVIADQLGDEWRPIVKSHEQNGREQTVIYVRPAGAALRMLIATYENDELNVVRVEIDGEQLSKFMKDMDDPTRHSRPHANDGSGADAGQASVEHGAAQ